MARFKTKRLAIDTFRICLSDIRAVERAQLHALSIAVGWPHRADDWEFLLDAGAGIAALDEIGRVLGTAMWFPHGETFATVGMVITSPRLQSLGAAKMLMEQVLKECEGRKLRLNATRAARRLYLSLDFAPGKTVFQCQGEARAMSRPPAPRTGAMLRRLMPGDLPAVIDMDARAFGVGRAGLMARLSEISEGVGLFRNGALEAFALCRRFGRGHVVGPVAAPDDAAAMAVVHPHVERLDRQFLRLDTDRDGGEFPAFLARCGLTVFDTVLAMARPGRPAFSPAQGDADCAAYALASQTLG